MSQFGDTFLTGSSPVPQAFLTSSSPAPQTFLTHSSSESSQGDDGLTAAERAEYELTRIMGSSPPPAEQTTDDVGLLQSLGEDFGGWSNSPFHQNEAVIAKNLSARHKLHPYQRKMVDDFVKDSSLIQNIKLFVAQCAIENKLDSIITSMPAFEVSEALMENIDSYVIAILLSTKLSAYKGMVPRNHAVAIALQNGTNLPPNIHTDQHAMNLIKTAIQNSFTQARSRIKKMIAKSKKSGSNSNIFDLATAIVSGSRCSITVSLCARLALLRKVHSEDPSNTFWDSVDLRLKFIRTAANGDTKKMTKALSAILTADRALYGISSTYTINDNAVDVWQQTIDNTIEAETAS